MFKVLAEYPGYRIHDDGRVQSCLVRSGPNHSCVPGRIWRDLTPATSWDGYSIVSIRDAAGKMWSRRVHRLVAAAFLPNPLNLPMVLHWDGDRKHNTLANLRWGNASMNVRDAQRHGTAVRIQDKAVVRYGEANAMTSIRADQALEIFLDRRTPHHLLARSLGVECHCVGGIRRGDRWRHVLEERIGKDRYLELLQVRPRKRVA